MRVMKTRAQFLEGLKTDSIKSGKARPISKGLMAVVKASRFPPVDAILSDLDEPFEFLCTEEPC